MGRGEERGCGSGPVGEMDGILPWSPKSGALSGYRRVGRFGWGKILRWADGWTLRSEGWMDVASGFAAISWLVWQGGQAGGGALDRFGFTENFRRFRPGWLVEDADAGPGREDLESRAR